MSATENEVCSLAMPYPSTVGKSTNCVTSTMPVSEEMDSSTSSNSGHPADCNGGTNGVNKDISLNLTQTLLNLKALNGQAKVTSKEEDIVILDNSPSSDANTKAAVSSVSSSPSLLPVSLLPKPPVSLTEGVRPAANSVYEHPKANKFEINERVRSSFKDIMSKIQENTPSLQNLLAKTKDLDTRERKEERERLEREQQAAKAMSMMGKGSGDNVFENLKGLNCDTDLSEKPITKNVDIAASSTALSIKQSTSSISNSKDSDVILLDDPEEESKPAVEAASVKPSQEQKDEINTDVAEETKTVKDCDNLSNVQSTIRDSSRSPICIDSDNSFENETPLKSESSSTLKAEEELLKIDQDEATNEKKEEETDTKEEEERLLASDSDDDKAKETKVNKVKKEDGEQKESAESPKMETEGKEDEILMLEADSESTEQEGKDCDESDVKAEKSDTEADVKENHKIKEEDQAKNESKETEESVSVKEEDDKKEIKKEVKESEVKMEVDEDDASQSSSSSSDSSASSKSGREDVKSQVKTEVKSEDSSSSVLESADRKRPADTSDLSAQPKRSRLDMVIGKLGSAIGIQPDTLKDEPDEDMSDVEESHESEVTESVKSEDTTSSVTEDEDDSPDSPKKKPGAKRRRIRLTESDLEQIVRTKVKMYMKVERDQKYKEMQDKVEELTQTIDFWKSNYRELERQVLNVTILQQKHEKRKAKTAALRELSTKNVGIQVDENKTNHMNNQLSQQTTPNKGTQATSNKTPTKTNSVGAFQPILVKNSTSGVTTPVLAPPNTSVLLSTNTVPPKLTPMTVTKMSQSLPTPGSPCLIQSLATTTGVANNALSKTVVQSPMDRSVKTLLENKRMVMPAGTKLLGANPPVSGLIPVLVTTSQPNMPRPPLLAKPSNTLTISTPGQSRPGDVVDLTGEEDTGMKRYTTPAASTSLVTGVPHGIPVTTVQPGGLVPQQILRPSIPNQAHGVASNSGILLSTPAGTQIMRNPNQTFQLVFNSTSPAIRPGSLLTVMQGPGGNNQIIRPIMTTTSGQPPQLRAAAAIQPPVQRANLSKPVVPSNVKILTRPPPPLQVAPPPALQVAQPINSAPPPKAVEPHHPAPLPVASSDQVKAGQKPLPPKPTLKISRVSQGIVLSWNMTLNQTPHAEVASYQLFAYQEGSSHPTTALWKKVGDVKALPLPMACTLTQFQEGNRYHFAVRAVDVHNRVGPFSEPNTIHLTSKKD